MDLALSTLYHFPGCPFSERLEILLVLKGQSGVIKDVVVDISSPRPAWLLEKTGGATALPALETPKGVLMESTAILRFLDRAVAGPSVIQADPYNHAIEEMLAGLSATLSGAGYRMMQNREPAQQDSLCAAVDAAYAKIDDFLKRHATGNLFLFDRFGWAEIMLTPTMKRLWCLDYYEGYKIPPALDRVAAWWDGCLSHPAAQGHSFEEIVKLYHDYTLGFGSGKIPAGRATSSFTIDPHWSTRPMPPRDKWGAPASDADLGLVEAP